MAGTVGAIQQPPASAGVLGQGVKYPLELDTVTGRLKLSWGPDLVQQAISSIEQTEPGERVMLPGYGAAATTFEPIDSDRHRLLVEQNIAEYEPRARSVNVDTQEMPTGELVVHVSYQLQGDATIRTLTAPLFTGPASTTASQ